jgi:hypothetical protein
MITDKQLKIGIGVLSLTLTVFVSLKIFNGSNTKKASTAAYPKRSVAASKKISEKLGSTDPKRRVIVDAKLLAETNSKINELNLVDPRVCKKQSDCPYDLFGVYKQSIDSNTVERNELSFVLLQRKIAQSNLPNAKKAELLKEILALTSRQLENRISSGRIGKKLVVTEAAGLYLATLESYIQTGASARQAVESVYDSISRSEDAFVNQMAVHMLMRSYPQYRKKMVDLFGKSEIKGLVVARN